MHRQYSPSTGLLELRPTDWRVGMEVARDGIPHNIAFVQRDLQLGGHNLRHLGNVKQSAKFV